MKFNLNEQKNHDDLKTIVCIIKTMKHLLERLEARIDEYIEFEVKDE